MGYPKKLSKASAIVRCRKHPKHEQSPGVCSICLSEKLSQLSGRASSSRSSSIFVSLDSSSSSSLSSCSLSSSSSSCASPVHRFRYNGNGNTAGGSLAVFLSGKNVLNKSRSLVFISRNKPNKENDDRKNDRWFLTKFLRHPAKKKVNEGLVHSRTLREFRIN